MLGLYSEELPNVRAESEAALSGALMRLEQGANAFASATETAEVGETAGEESLDEVAVEYAEPVLVTDSSLQNVTDKALDAELQDIFLAEAEEVLASLAQHSQALRVNSTDSEALAEVRRAYHTLKGSGRTVGLMGMSDVAWAVEKLLNVLMERKAFPTTKQLVFVESVSAEFAGWVAELQKNQSVTLDPTPFQQRALALESELEHDLVENKPKPQKEEVLIGGTRTLSKTFFNIFLAEAQQHLETLIEAQKTLVENSSELPTDASCRAAHTLGSNALTAGFKPTGDLARALEHWLDEHAGVWTEQHIALYGNVVKALADGLEKAKALKNPKSTRALILALGESTAAMQAIATQVAEAAVLEHQTDKEPEVTESLPADGEVNVSVEGFNT